MKPMRSLFTLMLATLLMQPFRAMPEDIDIYSGLGSAVNVPNVLIVLDNAASFDASTPGCSYADGSGAASMSGKVAGIEQCALYNTIKGLPTNPDGSARINLGFMVYSTTGIAAAFPSAGCASSNNGGCLLVPLTGMTAANKTSVMNWIKSWDTNTIKGNNQGNALAMQEAWAYYAGSTGASGRSYAGIRPAAGCQKNFVVYIGNAYRNNTTPGDNGSPSSMLTTAGNTNTSTITIPSGNYGLPSTYDSCGSYTMPNHNDTSGLYADEWARFMATADLYSATGEPSGTQNIVTYTIGALGPTCNAQYPALLSSMAHYGNGRYFPTDANNADSIAQALLKILNEVQAVNSVFSSSSLPVSVNAQGTYLNQIYMGMFRPDAGGLPRWAGNLKQYQFIVDPVTGALMLGDSIGDPAISSAGTGFLSSNAVSYWTCTRSDNPYLTGVNATGVANITATQLATLNSFGQICANDPAGGFWAKFPNLVNSAGGAFDLADGELVEKGGAGQRIRLDNLTDDYTAAAGTTQNPRKLYTYCPTGSNCQAALSHADNSFAVANAGITASLFGSTLTANISSIVRNASGTSGTTATVTTNGNHGFTSGDQVTIANAAQPEYNGLQTITVTDATHFTYTVVEYPTTPASASYTAQKSGAPVTISTLTRTNNTALATTSAAHGFVNGTTVVITGASPSAYNGSYVISVPTSTTFSFTVAEQPPTVAGSGATTCTATYTYATNPSNKTATVTVNAWNATTPGIQRAYGSSTVTVNTNTNLTTGSTKASAGNPVSLTGCVDSNGVSVAAYNTTTTIASISGTNGFTFTLPAGTVGPSSPASIASGYSAITASLAAAPQTISSLTRADVAGTTTATVTATTTGAHGYLAGDTVSIGGIGTVPSSESAYLGNYVVTSVPTATTFQYTINTTPVSPATPIAGASLTATRSTGFAAGDRDVLIRWMRGHDNYGDENSLCPPGSTAGAAGCPNPAVTTRPSVHGDVLHSRPTVLNYGGATIDILGTSDSGTTRTATISAADAAKIGGVGATATLRFLPGISCQVTMNTTTSFTYSAANCGNAGAQTVATDTSNVVVFYGDNGGVFHAVNGNQLNPPGSTLPAPGTELWGFIPKEHFIKLNRLRANSPQLNLPSTPPGISPAPLTKDYFVDGPTGVYQLVDTKGVTLTANIYLAMRRGGRMIYALNVTNPLAPQFLWKVDNTGLTNSSGTFVSDSAYGELGQTWSAPKVVKVQGYSNPVIIFAAGYDTNQDNDPTTSSDTMGRGIYVLDALTGALVWRAGYGAVSGTNNTIYTTTSEGTHYAARSDRMRYAIPSDVTLMDKDRDGYVDRLYVGDTGGQIWRVDFEPNGNIAPVNWTLTRLASLGECGTAVCRKFFYPPEVISTTTYDAVIAGTGDREHPLYNNTAATGKQNMVFLLKDTNTGNFVASTYVRMVVTDLFDATNATSTTCASGLASSSGYYMNLLDGEKVVNAPLVTAGYVYFGSNQPVAPSANSCVANLGQARGYKLAPFTCNLRSIVFAGGGLPPSPVSGVVSVNVGGTTKLLPFLIGGGNPDCTGADCGSALGGQKPPIEVSTSRIRTYWYKQGK